MKNADAWASYVSYTRDITENARKLAFAGIAVIWVLKPEQDYFDSLNLLALFFIILYFLIDVLQYIIAAERWYEWINKREKELQSEKGSIEGDYSPPRSLDIPVRRLLKVKIIFLFVGFILLGLGMIQKYWFISDVS